MTDRALVIGLDAYDNSAWELRAAVRDALRFAKWVTAPGAGRATTETLTLLLSPHPDRPVPDVKFEPATEVAIRRALFDHKTKGAEAKRLWFFYAGHGLAPAGGGPDEAPVVVPADVKDFEFYRSNPIDLGSWIREMQVCPPEYQIYFVDACRGIVVSEDVVTATKTLFFDLTKVKPDAQARQSILYATTAGQLANEQGLHGLFGGALIDGLHGIGPALEADTERQEFVLTFGGLAAYTKRRIQLQSDEVRRRNKTLPTQEPAESLFRVQSTLELARFREKPRSVVKVFIEPEEAAAVGTAGIRNYDDWTDQWERKAEKGSPLEIPVVWKLSSDVHKIEIEAIGFENWGKSVQVIGPLELHANLVRRRDDGGPESLSSIERTSSPPKPPDGAELAPGRNGKLVVEALDRYTRIEVFATDGKRVLAGWGSQKLVLPVGVYRVEISLPTESTVVQSVLVTADEPEWIEVRPDPQLTERLLSSASMIKPHDGMSEPSEAFGSVTTTHLGSVLAWAASAAQFDPNGIGQKLRTLGVQPVPTDSGTCHVRVLVGDALAAVPDSKGPIGSFLLLMNGEAATMTPVPALKGYAVQWHAPVSHHATVVLATNGLNQKRFPLPFIADHVWTIIIVREATQRTEIHRYLERLHPQHQFDDTIRLVEQSWRALEARVPLFEGEVELMLSRDLDPLGLAVLGYRLALENRWTEVKVAVERLGDVEIADAHVLAAFVGDRDKNMELAVMSPSVPVVGEGYRAMEAWITKRFAEEDMPPPIMPEPFTGGLWTTFDAGGQAVISRAFPVNNAPAWATPLLAAANATARIERLAGHPIPLIGTGFLIGRRKLALTDFVAKVRPAFAVFADQRVLIERIVGETNDDRHGAVAQIEPVEQAPLKIRWTLPEIGTRIAVIGHPMITSPTMATLAAFTNHPRGEKMIMPGVIVSVEETMLTYECWTMAGCAGGPILDLATGEVIGIHHSGKHKGGAKKLGFGVPVMAIEELLRQPV